MRRYFIASLVIACLFSFPAQAEFVISSAIVEFTADGPRQQDIELLSRSAGNDYIVAELAEIDHPGAAEESRHVLDDPEQGRLLVTPDKTILAAGSRKLLRFVLLQDPDAQEHVYRVAVKPVIKGVDNTGKVGLKILIGYEILVIVRPASMTPHYEAQRQGRRFRVANTGNTDILFQNGQQCATSDDCKRPPVLRVYPGQTTAVDLPLDQPVTYAIWDGATTVEKKFE